MDPQETHLIYVITLVLAACTCIFLLLALLSYLFLRALRTFPTELVFYLCLSELFANIVSMIPTNRDKQDKIPCVVQSIGETLFPYSSLLWSSIIGYTAYISLRRQDFIKNNKKTLRCVFLVISFLIPFGLAST